MNFPKLDFYYFDACPYCQRVINVIKKNNIKVTWLNILEDSKSLRKLIDTTGTKMVPCLFIDEKPMHESLDIMRWLEDNLEKLERNN